MLIYALFAICTICLFIYEVEAWPQWHSVSVDLCSYWHIVFYFFQAAKPSCLSTWQESQERVEEETYTPAVWRSGGM